MKYLIVLLLLISGCKSLTKSDEADHLDSCFAKTQSLMPGDTVNLVDLFSQECHYESIENGHVFGYIEVVKVWDKGYLQQIDVDYYLESIFHKKIYLILQRNKVIKINIKREFL